MIKGNHIKVGRGDDIRPDPATTATTIHSSILLPLLFQGGSPTHHRTVDKELNRVATGTMLIIIINNNLESAVQRPAWTAHYNPHAPTHQLAAELAYGIIMNHPFADWIKRTAFLAVNEYLRGAGATSFVNAESQQAAAAIQVIGAAHSSVAQQAMNVDHARLRDATSASKPRSLPSQYALVILDGPSPIPSSPSERSTRSPSPVTELTFNSNPDAFGVFRRYYRIQKQSFRSVQLEGNTSTPSESPSPDYFDTAAKFRLMDYLYGRSHVKSQEDFNDLIAVLRSDGLNMDNLRDFSAEKVEKLLDDWAGNTWRTALRMSMSTASSIVRDTTLMAHRHRWIPHLRYWIPETPVNVPQRMSSPSANPSPAPVNSEHAPPSPMSGVSIPPHLTIAHSHID
ncbi:hypothetical protein BN946_scf184969.g30 [Trametes cinnabarina]|uniref:Fido domain-containing protein n=1 Tax=Pycnoporus cinnabarinus TaxID=5643 RepID=A0A060SZI8_PYCCI|nr:hypothetical protein BN946_scf184969.g30 [Trametes cinnabarina]